MTTTAHPVPSRHARDILALLQEKSDPANIRGMVRYGIRPGHSLGISMKTIRSIAGTLEPNHNLAAQLWKSGIHEARILASIVDEPELVSIRQMNQWVRGFDSWDLCDQCCANLFEKTTYAWSSCVGWSRREEEFIKRAGFSLMARLAVSDKKAEDRRFLRLLPHIRRGAKDERNFVKKSVSWALRQLGKRNLRLNREAIVVSRDLTRSSNAAARWVGMDALSELRDPKTQERIRRRGVPQP